MVKTYLSVSIMTLHEDLQKITNIITLQARFVVITTVLGKSPVFWPMTSCRLVYWCKSFVGPFCFHFQCNTSRQ